MNIYYIVYGLFSIALLLASWLLMSKKLKLGWSLYCYYLMLICSIGIINTSTWNNCSTNIAVFYLCIGVVFVLYLIFCIYSISFHKKAYHLSRKEYHIITCKVLITIIGLVIVFWILVLLGKFVYDNSIIETEDVYDLIPDSHSYLPSFELIVGELKASLRFFEIGIIQLFAYNSNNSTWAAFFQSARWIFGSIIIITILNVITNVLGIGSMSFSDIKVRESDKSTESPTNK